MLCVKTAATRTCVLFLVWLATHTEVRAGEFDSFLLSLIQKKCVRCHGGDEVNGKIDFKGIATTKQLLAKPDLIKEVIDVIDANDMPPEGEPQLEGPVRERLLATLRSFLREATAGGSATRVPIRRLNRFQYNNAVRDIFQLKPDVFPLPEKLMTRHSDYLATGVGRMPAKVQVASHSLNPAKGLREVVAFPKDLRASHGFDNQANQLTLSPLLLDAFLRLSVSIVESPDFNEQNVGIWRDFFLEPGDAAEMATEMRSRLTSFLLRVFRRPADSETLDRYTAYALAKLEQGLPFADTMKKVASAALSSPLFLYRSGAADGAADQFELAANLSFFLWASCPDTELLQLAEKGELSIPATFNGTIERMFADRKIERFLDTFPAQWLQLENVLAATPDPQKQRLFSLDKSHPASLQMLLEPLLLFDAAFIEDRPIVELISPEFSYRSEFLKTWYTSNLRAPEIDTAKIVEENRKNEQQRKVQQAMIASAQAELDALINPVGARLLAARIAESGDRKPADLKPYAAWEFDGDLKTSVGPLDLKAHGKILFHDGAVVLNRAFLQSDKIPIELKAKTLEVWFKPHDVKQRGGGVMGIQGPGDFFDTIVLGERKPQHWISGSNGFSRTKDFPESTPEEKPNQLLHLAMVYTEDGTTTLYRNGIPYGKPFRKGSATFPKNQSSVIFGLRHLPPGGNKFLSVTIDKARFYNRPLMAEEVSSSFSGYNQYISDEELLAALTEEQRTKKKTLSDTIARSRTALEAISPSQDIQKLRLDVQRRFDDDIRRQLRSTEFERVVLSDPRYGGVITNAAMLSMTSGPKRTHPIARGAWIIEVILNDPPPPPPNDVPPLNEAQGDQNLTIREKFAVHRENPDCAGCHSRLDPLGFALENFDITGRWRDKYDNGRDVDPGGTLMRKYKFNGIVDFKTSLVKERRRVARAFTGHLLRFAVARELTPADSLTIDTIVDNTEPANFKLREIIKEVARSASFLTLSIAANKPPDSIRPGKP